MLHPLKAPGRAVLVSEAARRCNLTPRAIRFYEEQGLIDSMRGPAGQRLFDPSTLDRLIFISEARALGLSVREVRELLTIGDTEGLAPQRTRLREHCTRRLGDLDEQRRIVEATMRTLNRPAAPSTLRMAG